MPRGARLDAPGTLHHVMMRKRLRDDDPLPKNLFLSQYTDVRE